jgi:hypothetical protein
MLAPSLGYWEAIVVAHSREGGKKNRGERSFEAKNDMICPNTMFVVAGASLNCILVV